MYRKPLIVMSSKRLLRFRGASSSLEEMEEGKRFKWVIGDDLKVEGIKKVFLCSG
jgi:2-oxoglutarate dehydrogenase E1 component